MLILILLSLLTFSAHSSKATKPPNQSSSTRSLSLVPNRVTLTKGRSAGTFALNLPKEFGISVAVEGLKRVRFMARSPEGRIFVTDMFNLTDNKRGVVYILDQFDPATRTFKKVTQYLKDLRNPNSIAFYTDPQGVNWFYLALTDRLVRYKYGGWHLTRTIAIGGNGKIYVAVGSSCNACEEKEEVRASVLEMDPDGKHQRHFARGLRNAVGLRWIEDRLYATNMGSDHLGDQKPADTMYAVKSGMNYGWPYCYQSGVARLEDPRFSAGGKKKRCRDVPVAFAAFDAHSSPLGFEFFDSLDMGPVPKSGYGDSLKDSFLVALHGSTKKSLNRGYRVVRLMKNRKPADRPEDFINGFLAAGKINGRP